MLYEIINYNDRPLICYYYKYMMNPFPSFCSLTVLLDVCRSLDRIGNLDRWNIPNLGTVLSRIKSQYKWKCCPVFHNSKVESPITT